MSIIQEALKKIQYNIHAEEVYQKSQQKDKVEDTPSFKKPTDLVQETQPNRNNFKLIILLSVIFVVSAGFAVKQFVDVRSPSSRQEVIYKPISKTDIKLEDKIANVGQAVSQAIETKPRYPDLSLNGIMYLEDGPRAIINNSIVEVGNTVAGATVTKINKKSVVLESNGVEITLKLK